MKHLVIDSGASKTEWVYFDGQSHHSFKTEGIHPYYLKSTTAFNEFYQQFSSFYQDETMFPFDKIYYFGTGCADEQSKSSVEEKLRLMCTRWIPESRKDTVKKEPCSIFVNSDVDGAAKATFPVSEGIMILLGTGTIFAHVDSGNIIHRIPSLGYVLGDEGSAAYLGKQIYIGYYRKLWSPETLRLILERTDFLDYGAQMSKLYSSTRPSAHLGRVAQQVLSEPITNELKFWLGQQFISAFTLAKELLPRDNPFEKAVRTSIRDEKNSSLEPTIRLPIALSGGVIQAHQKLAKSCAEIVFKDHSVTLFPSFARPLSEYLENGVLPLSLS